MTKAEATAVRPLKATVFTKRPKVETLLKKWLDAKRLSQYSVAKACGFLRTRTSKLISGQTKPTLVDAFKIQLFTKGDVPASYWLDTPLCKEEWDTVVPSFFHGTEAGRFSKEPHVVRTRKVS